MKIIRKHLCFIHILSDLQCSERVQRTVKFFPNTQLERKFKDMFIFFEYNYNIFLSKKNMNYSSKIRNRCKYKDYQTCYFAGNRLFTDISLFVRPFHFRSSDIDLWKIRLSLFQGDLCV